VLPLVVAAVVVPQSQAKLVSESNSTTTTTTGTSYKATAATKSLGSAETGASTTKMDMKGTPGDDQAIPYKVSTRTKSVHVNKLIVWPLLIMRAVKVSILV
jgi:hypothetical protein